MITSGIRIGSTTESDPSIAAAELHRQLNQDRMALAVVFLSSRYDLEVLAPALEREFAPTPIIGCTTAGEIGPRGYTDGGLSGLSLGQAEIVAEIGVIEDVSHLHRRRGQAFAYELRQRLCERVPDFDPRRSFALLLADGMCRHEEHLARALNDGLGGIPLVGGSAGDGMRFRGTSVLYGGRSLTDAAVLLVATTRLRFLPIKTQHFVSGLRRLVVTGAYPEQRVVTEINGLPAAEEYARVVGISPAELDSGTFSTHPMVVKVGGSDFVRSIQKVNDDGSMTFFCAIDEGIVFNIARGGDLVADLATLFADVGRRIGPPSLVIGCDCILRRLEIAEKGLTEQVSALWRAHNVVGFNTYGEQFRGMHVNQTFTGIAFGSDTAP